MEMGFDFNFEKRRTGGQQQELMQNRLLAYQRNL